MLVLGTIGFGFAFLGAEFGCMRLIAMALFPRTVNVVAPKKIEQQSTNHTCNDGANQKPKPKCLK